MMNHWVDQRVRVHRGKYEGLQGTILEFTSKQVYLRLLDGREIRISQNSLHPPENPAPTRQQLLAAVPNLSEGQRVEVYRGKYEGDYGRVVGLTRCKVYVLLEGANREVRIDKTSVREVPSQDRPVSFRRSSQSRRAAQARLTLHSSDFSSPQNSTPTTRFPQQSGSRIVTSIRRTDNLHEANTPVTYAAFVPNRSARVVTPPHTARNNHVPRLSQQLPTRFESHSRRQVDGQRRELRSPSSLANLPDMRPQVLNFLVNAPVPLNTRSAARERIIADLPITTVEDPAALAEQCRTCVVCFEDLETGHQLKRLPCMHGFHSGCIDTWIRRNPTCPLCNYRLTRNLFLH